MRCHAWLYLPLAGEEAKEGERRKAPPVVLMGHGLGGQKVGSSFHSLTCLFVRRLGEPESLDSSSLCL